MAQASVSDVKPGYRLGPALKPEFGGFVGPCVLSWLQSQRRRAPERDSGSSAVVVESDVLAKAVSGNALTESTGPPLITKSQRDVIKHGAYVQKLNFEAIK